ncbi:MAG: glutathione S-transferase N-terminal domain-containing protein [Burkholderiaceae bacterium]
MVPPPIPVLYSFRRCPYAMRARLALAEAGVAVETREIVLRDKPAALLAASPKGTVPVLVLPGGEVLEQSLDIMRWALHGNDPAGWLTAAPEPRQQALIALNDEQFKPLLDRYKYPQRFPEAAAAAYRDAALALMLAPLERALAAHAHLLGPDCSLADIAVLPFVRQFAAVDAAWFEQQAPLPALRAWLRRLLDTPLFEAAMVKRPPWQAPQQPPPF